MTDFALLRAKDRQRAVSGEQSAHAPGFSGILSSNPGADQSRQVEEKRIAELNEVVAQVRVVSRASRQRAG